MSKEVFKEYCEKHPEVPVSLQYDHLAGVLPNDSWGVAMAGTSHDPKGFFIYYIKRRWGFTKITMPPLAPYMGPWIVYPKGQKAAQRYGHEKKVLSELIDQLPDFDDLELDFHPGLQNLLPFHWKGFRSTVRFTYILRDLSDLDRCSSDLKGNTRRAINKAKERLEVYSSEEIDKLHELRKADFAMKEEPMLYSYSYFQDLDQVLASKGQRKILYAKDKHGRVHGGIYLTFNENECCYLIGAIDPELRQEGSMPLLVWEGIRVAAEKGLSFNFEGSDIESIENFFRSFGAEQVPFYRVRKTPSFLLRGHYALRSLLGKS